MTSYGMGIKTIWESSYQNSDGCTSKFKVQYDTSSGMLSVGIEIPNETVEHAIPQLITKAPVHFLLEGNRPEHEGIQGNYHYADETNPTYGWSVVPFTVCDSKGNPIIYKDEEWARNILKSDLVHHMDGSWTSSVPEFVTKLWDWIDEVIWTWDGCIDHGDACW